MMLEKESFRNAVVQGVRELRKDPDLTIADSQPFRIVGLDSLDMMNLVLEVEGALNVNFGELDVGEDDTVETFFRKAAAQLSKG